MTLSVKHLLTYSFLILLCPCLPAQRATEQPVTKADSIYGYRSIHLESSYTSLKQLLGPKYDLNPHEYSCVVTDTSYLRSNLLSTQTISVTFFDDKVRTIFVQVHDSTNVVKSLRELTGIYGPNYIMPAGQHEHSATISNNKSYVWSGTRSSVSYTIFLYPLANGPISWNGNITLKSAVMECYASKVLGEKYWPEEEGGMRCPRIDPCTP